MSIKSYKINYYKSKLSDIELNKLLDLTETYIIKNSDNFDSFFIDSKFKTDFSRSTIKKNEFYNIIDYHFKQFVDEKKIDVTKIRIPTLWVNVCNKDEFQYFHTHFPKGRSLEFKDPHYSGTIYLKCPKDSGDFAFCNSDGSNLKRIQPAKGEIMIFPSFLPHGVTPNKTNKKRISVSFNIHTETINHPWETYKGYIDKVF